MLPVASVAREFITLASERFWHVLSEFSKRFLVRYWLQEWSKQVWRTQFWSVKNGGMLEVLGIHIEILPLKVRHWRLNSHLWANVVIIYRFDKSCFGWFWRERFVEVLALVGGLSSCRTKLSVTMQIRKSRHTLKIHSVRLVYWIVSIVSLQALVSFWWPLLCLWIGSHASTLVGIGIENWSLR